MCWWLLYLNKYFGGDTITWGGSFKALKIAYFIDNIFNKAYPLLKPKFFRKNGFTI